MDKHNFYFNKKCKRLNDSIYKTAIDGVDYIIKDLAYKLGPDAILKGNSIKYNGVNINYYSETEKIHIGKKKFGTADEALEYLKGESSEERVDPEFEAKNYKLSHRHKRIK